MRFIVILFFSILLLTLINGVSQSITQTPDHSSLRELYRKADKFYQEGEEIVKRKDYTEEKEIQLNKNALASFKIVASQLAKVNPAYDSLAFFTHFKIGVLEHYFDDLDNAENSYLKAIELKHNLPELSDTFLFKPLLYYGIILYNENLFDSAISIYKKAEKIALTANEPLEETERLYNTLGALYYETGNYRQARNYTEKSLSIIPRTNPYYKQLVVNYKINLASILTRLEDFDEANRIYQEILPENINKDIILHNTGVINLRLGSIRKALTYFKNVNYTDNRRSRLYNDMAQAYMNINEFDSARYYLNKAEEIDSTVSRKTVVKGQTQQLWGDLYIAENKITDAIKKYQQAIILYYPEYADTTTTNNPEYFSGIFSYIYLFNTLTAKAEAFESLFNSTNEIKFLKTAINTYTAAFKLADYVERSYDSDEARLFLNRIKYGVHSRPIDISLKLVELTKDRNYLEQAWQFDQKNKASILSFNVFENELREKDNLPGRSDREKEIRSAITRLSLKAAQEINTNKLKDFNNEIRDYEIELGQIQEKSSMRNDLKNIDRAIPKAEWLQKNLLDDKSAILSYHLSETDLLIICISQQQFFYKKVTILPPFYPTIDSFVRATHIVNGENKYSASTISNRLYQWLIRPVMAGLNGIERLVIIPDDELNYIPFEALQNEKGEYLVEKFSVQYQYSAALLKKNKIKSANPGTLSFAPFINSLQGNYNKLSYSYDEIAELKGKRFMDKEAAKDSFLAYANKYKIIHLATHAKVNDINPLQSYITFSPWNDRDSNEHRLYEQEIYDLNLDSTKLVILSACETGTGQLIHGEGLMSLSRAFAFAGCQDIVTSLWKAEDKTTAFITRRFHYYLNKNKTTDEALHLAKLDLLSSDEIDERLKTPNYWAHMIFIGGYEKSATPFFNWWFLIPVLLIPLYWIVYKKRQHKRV